jgi:hypothetical protein
MGWLVGVFLGAANLLPFRTASGFVTDGVHILFGLFYRTPGAKAVLRFRMLSAQGRRPRDWGTSVDAVLQAAEHEPRHREVLLVGALGVALDTDDRTRAEEILQRVADGPPARNPLVRYEFELKAVMIEALRGDMTAARARLGSLGRHPMIADYPRLAEAVVHAVEGNMTAARSALQAWERVLSKTGLGTALRVGNEWAEEEVRHRLAT